MSTKITMAFVAAVITFASSALAAALAIATTSTRSSRLSTVVYTACGLVAATATYHLPSPGVPAGPHFPRMGQIQMPVRSCARDFL